MIGPGPDTTDMAFFNIQGYIEDADFVVRIFRIPISIIYNNLRIMGLRRYINVDNEDGFIVRDRNLAIEFLKVKNPDLYFRITEQSVKDL